LHVRRFKEKSNEESGGSDDESDNEEDNSQLPVLSAAPIKHPLGAVNRIRVGCPVSIFSNIPHVEKF